MIDTTTETPLQNISLKLATCLGLMFKEDNAVQIIFRDFYTNERKNVELTDQSALTKHDAQTNNSEATFLMLPVCFIKGVL